MSYCSRSRRRRFTVLNFKSAFSRICGHCLQHFTAHAQKRLFRNFQQKFLQFGDVFRWFFLHFICWMSFDSPTPISLQCAKFRRFGDVFHRFLHFITWQFAVFLLPVYFTYCAKFKVDMSIHCRVIVFLLLLRCVTLWPWLLTLWPWPGLVHGGSRGQHCQKVRRSYAYPFLSYEL